MKSRYYLGILIATLTVLGWLAGHQHNLMHNQVAVIQFPETLNHSPKAIDIIEAVKKQLLNEGAENITVYQNEKGDFILKYFSKKNVETVEKGISSISGFNLDKFSLDLVNKANEGDANDNDIPEFSIYEIQNWHDFDSSMDQSAAIIIKSDFLRYTLNIDPHFDLCNLELDNSSHLIEVHLKCQQQIVLKIRKTFNIIPDVRAGPLQQGDLLA